MGRVSEPAYRRMQVDERRAQLLAHGADLFARFSYEELSMARIAREAGVSKALLYHYFPSKRDYFVGAFEAAAAEVAERTEPDPSLAPLEALQASVTAYLGWVEENAPAYRRLIESAAGTEEAGSLVQDMRSRTAERILEGLLGGDEPPAKVRTAVRAWLWYMDGAILDWLEHRDLEAVGARGPARRLTRGGPGRGRRARSPAPLSPGRRGSWRFGGQTSPVLTGPGRNGRIDRTVDVWPAAPSSPPCSRPCSF